MDKVMEEYRTKHPRCRYCKYCKTKEYGLGHEYTFCDIKNKLIRDLKLTIGGMFCSCFRPSDK